MISIFISSNANESIRISVFTRNFDNARRLAERKFREEQCIGRPYYIGIL